MFNVFTDVPLPGRFCGLIVDDLNFSSDPKSTAVRREGRRALRPGRHLRLHQPAGDDRRVRLQRPLRRAAALDQPDQLPDAVRRLRQPVPVRRQRPGDPGQAQPELQPAVPDDRRRVRGDARPDVSGIPIEKKIIMVRTGTRITINDSAKTRAPIPKTKIQRFVRLFSIF